MGREVYDPKKPEFEFYNEIKPRERKPPVVKVSIFARKRFMFLYGIFLTFFVAMFLMTKWGFFDNIPFFSALRRGNKPIEIKISGLDIYEYEESVVATIEVENLNYTNEINIDNLKAKFTLYKNKRLIFTGNNNFYNVIFPLGQRIGFKMPFDKNYWDKSNRLEVILSLDDDLTFTNDINIRRIRK